MPRNPAAARLVGIMAGGLMLSVASWANATTIFGTAHLEGGFGGLSTLYSVNSTTGAATAIGTNLGFIGVSAMDFNPNSGILYGIGRLNDTDQRLFSVNTTTGIGTSVADIPDEHSFGNRYSGMSFRSDGTLFVYLEGGDGLGTLSLGGTLTELGGIGGPNSFGNGIAFAGSDDDSDDGSDDDSDDGSDDDSDILFHATHSVLNTLNQSTGSPTQIALITYPAVPNGVGFPRINGMDFDGLTGTMFVSINDGFGGSGPNFLGTIDPATGIVSSIGSESVPGLDSIAVQAEATSEPIPEPGTLALFGLGLLALGFARRKKVA